MNQNIVKKKVGKRAVRLKMRLNYSKMYIIDLLTVMIKKITLISITENNNNNNNTERC